VYGIGHGGLLRSVSSHLAGVRVDTPP
jgi:hypothetical protein